MCGSSSGERLLSELHLIKNHLRSLMKNDRLSALDIMNIEVKILNIIEFDDILSGFINKKLRYQCSAKPS